MAEREVARGRGHGGTSGRSGAFWTERKVAWYRRALERSDYADKVLGALGPILQGCETALDVGAGCGALTLPLAARLRHVTAMEPAPAMVKALREEARIRGLTNVKVIEAVWGDVPVGRHDLVLCAHVGELTRPGSAFLRDVSSVAARGVVLVRDATGDADKFFFRELYPKLLGRPYESGCSREESIERLAALGAASTVTMVAYHSDQPFADLEEACDFWEEYLGVGGDETRAFLRRFLAARLTHEASGWVAPYPKQAAVIWWRAGSEASR